MREVKSGTYELLRTDGTTHLIADRPTLDKIHRAIKARVCDSVNLRNGCVMIVDDMGAVDDLPINHRATELYHEVCRPGTTAAIYGDAAIVRDSDFA